VKRFRFHPEARIEARSSATWYRERSREAALTFTSTVTEAVQAIRERPEVCAPWRHTEVRRRILRRFPYSIFYVVEKDLVVIVAVAHHKRRPSYWLPRRSR
jgi:toxin ParE1/3/4